MIPSLTTAARCLTFYMAILCSLVIVPVVLAGGVNSHPQVFVGLVAVHVVCLVAGHDYRPPDR